MSSTRKQSTTPDTTPEAQAPVGFEQQRPQAPAVEAPKVSLAKLEAPKALTVEDIASAVGASPKDVRRWLRKQTRAAASSAAEAREALPGKGGRYAFTQAQAQALIGAYGRSKGAVGTQAPALLILAALAPEAPVVGDVVDDSGRPLSG